MPGSRLGTWVESKAIPVDDLKDAAGSGDWCTAGLLSKVATKGYAGFSNANDEQIGEAIRFGQALAAWNCRFEGARGGMYAVSTEQFHEQIDKILSGSSKVIPITKGPSISIPNASVVCRVCEHAGSQTKRKRRKSK
jgi:fructokinase